MLTYLLEVTLCWTILYSIFYLCMRRETFFKINRWYLLSALLFGLLMPLLRFIPIIEEVELYNRQVAEYIPIVYAIKDSPAIVAHTITEQSIEWGYIFQISLWTLYAVGCMFFLFRFSKGLLSIYKLYQQGEKTIKGTHTLIKTSQEHLPFSFLKMVFVSKKLPLNEDYNRILTHELEHVRANHSIDVLLLEIINIIFWFHPMIYLYKSALRQTHEYLADAAVCGNDSRQLYGQLLLRQSLSGLEIALAHHFFHSHIKKRINMIYQEKSGRKAWLKYALAVPALAVLMLVFTSQTTKSEDNTDNQQKLLSTNANETFDQDEFEKAFTKTLTKLPEKQISKSVKNILKKEISDELKTQELETLYHEWLSKYPKEDLRIKDIISWEGPINRRTVGFSRTGKIILRTPVYHLPGFTGYIDDAIKIEMENLVIPTYKEVEIEMERVYETKEISFLHNYLRWNGLFHKNKKARTEINRLFKKYANEYEIELGFDLKELRIQHNVRSPEVLKSIIRNGKDPMFWGTGPNTTVFTDNFNLSEPIGMFAYLSPADAIKVLGQDGKNGFVAMSFYSLGDKHPIKMRAALDRDIENFFSTIDQLPSRMWINKLKKVHLDLSSKYGDNFDPVTPFSNIAHKHNITLVFKEGKIIKAYRGNGDSTERIDTDSNNNSHGPSSKSPKNQKKLEIVLKSRDTNEENEPSHQSKSQRINTDTIHDSSYILDGLLGINNAPEDLAIVIDGKLETNHNLKIDPKIVSNIKALHEIEAIAKYPKLWTKHIIEITTNEKTKKSISDKASFNQTKSDNSNQIDYSKFFKSPIILNGNWEEYPYPNLHPKEIEQFNVVTESDGIELYPYLNISEELDKLASRSKNRKLITIKTKTKHSGSTSFPKTMNDTLSPTQRANLNASDHIDTIITFDPETYEETITIRYSNDIPSFPEVLNNETTDNNKTGQILIDTATIFDPVTFKETYKITKYPSHLSSHAAEVKAANFKYNIDYANKVIHVSNIDQNTILSFISEDGKQVGSIQRGAKSNEINILIRGLDSGYYYISSFLEGVKVMRRIEIE